ncbi:MAG: PEP-CTERM sorting domain-containing protein [Opitutae bacterium]|nr:PEP-CTERM sorting domain-containing protein [Opitutae bacterium]
MSRRHLAPALLVALGLLLNAATLNAIVIELTWTGYGTTNDLFDANNWAGGVAPTNDGNANLIFGNARKSHVTHFGFNVYQLTFSGNSQTYFLEDLDGNTYIGAGGIIYNPTQPIYSVIEDFFELTDSQTWHIASGTLELRGYIYDGDSDYVFTKTGAGTLVLGHNDNAFDASEIRLNDGRMVLTPSSVSGRPIGYATLTIGAPLSGSPVLVADEGSLSSDVLTLNNDITVNGVLATENHTDIHVTGGVILNTDTTIKANGRDWLYLEGVISDGPTSSPAPRKLTIDSTTAVILDTTPNGIDGTRINTYSGGTHVQNGILVFANLTALPANPVTNALTSSANGYIGFGDDGTNITYSFNLQTDFLDRFDKANTHGTVGFDTDPLHVSSTTFTGAINLTGFASDAKLGSATRAILSGTITPQVTDYRFGGGGGWLQVDSQLTGSRALVVDSPSATPLTLRLTYSGNDYTGGTFVTNSGLIFGSSGLGGVSFPIGTGNVTINAGGYVGFETWGDQSTANLIINSLAKISTTSVGAVGFDSIGTLSVPIDLSSFTGALYLGTSTWANGATPGLKLMDTSVITPAGGASAPYRFAGYKGGYLEVASTLTGANGVHIGDPDSPGTFADYNKHEYSTVALTGNNSTLTGNISFYGGQLIVGQSNGVVGTDATTALGTGTLNVVGMTLPPEWEDEHGGTLAPQIDALTDNLKLPNAVNLGTKLQIGGSGNILNLVGQITGTGSLYLEDYAELRLGNDANSFSGGVYLAGPSTLYVDAPHATGTGMLSFGNTSASYVYFNTAAPVVNGLSSNEESDYAYLKAQSDHTVLTVNQTSDASFRGQFEDLSTALDLRVLKTGAGTLRLDNGGLYFYNGSPEASLTGTPGVSLEIDQGTVILGSNFYVEHTVPTFWVHGGTLALDNRTLSNPLVIDNGGRLGGNGTYANSLAIGTGATLAPGFTGLSAIGRLDIYHLELNSGGTFEWQIQDPNSSDGHDQIDVSTPATLVINATSADKFTLKIVSLDLSNVAGGALSGLDQGHGVYSWTLFSTDAIDFNGTASGTGTFDPTVFNLDLSLMNISALPLGGSFALANVGNDILLNFTPVPEPSTYALLTLGLGLTGFAAWRRRRD